MGSGEGVRYEEGGRVQEPSVALSAARLENGTLEIEVEIKHGWTRWSRIQVLRPCRGEHAVLALPTEDNALYLCILGIDQLDVP
jgi:hypothetical protein